MLDVWSSPGKHLVLTVKTGLSQDMRGGSGGWKIDATEILVSGPEAYSRHENKHTKTSRKWPVQINLPFFLRCTCQQGSSKMFHNQGGRFFFKLCLEVCGFHVWINQVQLFQKGRAWIQISGSQLLCCGATDPRRWNSNSKIQIMLSKAVFIW